MSAIKQRFLCSIVGTVLFALVALWCVFNATWQAAILLASATIILTFITVKASGGYQSARLIFENPILKVDMASVSKIGDASFDNTVKAVVSGFGIMIDEKTYKFGHGGIVLMATTIDRESITLSFGDNNNRYSFRLLHGLADKAEVDKLIERLHYETGVIAKVSGW